MLKTHKKEYSITQRDTPVTSGVAVHTLAQVIPPNNPANEVPSFSIPYVVTVGATLALATEAHRQKLAAYYPSFVAKAGINYWVSTGSPYILPNNNNYVYFLSNLWTADGEVIYTGGCSMHSLPPILQTNTAKSFYIDHTTTE